MVIAFSRHASRDCARTSRAGAKTFGRPPGGIALEGRGAVAGWEFAAVRAAVGGYQLRLARLRHAAVLVAPVGRPLGHAARPREVLAEAVGDVGGRLADVDDALLLVGELVDAGHGVAPA